MKFVEHIENEFIGVLREHKLFYVRRKQGLRFYNNDAKEIYRITPNVVKYFGEGIDKILEKYADRNIDKIKKAYVDSGKKHVPEIKFMGVPIIITKSEYKTLEKHDQE